ncbi:MAG: damage-inducible protein CinA, partial [Tidjanibacter sp.]|nr:damage-inducible protein CinA [Tidjanibacter sp.]
MNCSIITIGDEILIGQIVDTNSATIAQMLGEVGVRVVWRVTVGDGAEQIRSAVSEAMERTPLVIITG